MAFVSQCQTCNIMSNPLFDDEDVYASSNDLVMEELLRLREQVVTLQERNTALQKNLQETQALKIQLENSILMQTNIEPIDKKQKKKRSEPTREAQAFARFMNEQKTNEEVQMRIKNNIQTLGYKLEPKKHIPFQLLKLECERLFSQMSIEEKQSYYV